MTTSTLRDGTLEAYLDAAQARSLPLSEIFLEREAQSSGRPKEELLALMHTRIAVMRHSLKRGLAAPQRSKSGLVDGGAYRLMQWSKDG
ncbi:MAG: hypothetical protein Q8O00_12330, partial [Holophaga sp.]|nr:hypothetical protein [Holophaga sp.]